MLSRGQLVPIALDDIDPGVVHQDVQPVEGVADVVSNVLNLAGVGQIRWLDVGLAGLADAARDVFQRCGTPAGQNNRGAFLRQCQRGGLTNASACTGDPGDLTRKSGHMGFLMFAADIVMN